jgi:hypothetical protein
LRECRTKGISGAIVTIIHAQGFTPCEIGAVMVMNKDGDDRERRWNKFVFYLIIWPKEERNFSPAEAL